MLHFLLLRLTLHYLHLRYTPCILRRAQLQQAPRCTGAANASCVHPPAFPFPPSLLPLGILGIGAFCFLFFQLPLKNRIIKTKHDFFFFFFLNAPDVKLCGRIPCSAGCCRFLPTTKGSSRQHPGAAPGAERETVLPSPSTSSQGSPFSETQMSLPESHRPCALASIAESTVPPTLWKSRMLTFSSTKSQPNAQRTFSSNSSASGSPSPALAAGSTASWPPQRGAAPVQTPFLPQHPARSSTAGTGKEKGGGLWPASSCLASQGADWGSPLHPHRLP